MTDCPCGGPRRLDGDGERWEVLCDWCGRRTPPPPAHTDDQIREWVRAYWAQRKGKPSC